MKSVGRHGLASQSILNGAGNVKAGHGERGNKMYKEVEEKPEVISTSITLHGKDGAFMIVDVSYKTGIELYDAKSEHWLDKPVYSGSLCGLMELLQNREAELMARDNSIRSLMIEIDELNTRICELEDNQVKEPVH